MACSRVEHIYSSVRLEERNSHWTDFSWNFMFVVFNKICRQLSFLLKSDEDNTSHEELPKLGSLVMFRLHD